MSEGLPAQLRAAAGRLYQAVEVYGSVQGRLEAAATYIERLEAAHAAERAAWEQERAELRDANRRLSHQVREEELRTAAEAARVWACHEKLKSYGITR